MTDGNGRMPVAIVHDYLTQRGGAERVVLALCRAFPSAPVFTSMYDPGRTYRAFQDVDVRVTWLNWIGPLRTHHRAALPLLATTFSRMRIDAEVTIASSSGWAHGASTTGAKVVYCHTPARWLHHPRGYLGRWQLTRRMALRALRPALLAWDRRAANSAHRYLCNSEHVRQRILAAYGIEAEVLPPPAPRPFGGDPETLPNLNSGFFLVVSRLLPYKNVESVVRAAAIAREPVVIVGSGPDLTRLRTLAGEEVVFTGQVSDSQLRWLYRSCEALVCAGVEDFGLAPLEAAAQGRPTLALRAGGYLESVVEGKTGLFFDQADPQAVADAMRRARATIWDTGEIRAHSERFSEARFTERIKAVVAELASQSPRRSTR